MNAAATIRPTSKRTQPQSLWQGIDTNLDRVEVMYFPGAKPRYELQVDRKPVEVIQASRQWQAEQRRLILTAQRMCRCEIANGHRLQIESGISAQTVVRLGRLIAENMHANDPSRSLRWYSEIGMALAWGWAEISAEAFHTKMAEEQAAFCERDDVDEAAAKERVTFY